MGAVKNTRGTGAQKIGACTGTRRKKNEDHQHRRQCWQDSSVVELRMVLGFLTAQILAGPSPGWKRIEEEDNAFSFTRAGPSYLHPSTTQKPS